MPIDYSSWKKIDVSDDEDETMKHIEKSALFRWRHQSRLEKMAQAKRERAELKRKNEKVQSESADVRKRLDEGTDLDQAEREKLTGQLNELLQQEAEIQEKAKECDKKDRLRPWNVDTIGHTGFNKSRINKSPTGTYESQAPAETKEHLEEFYAKNVELIRKFVMLNTLEETETFLLQYPYLCCEDTSNCLANDCMDFSLHDKHEMAEKVAEQATLLNYLLELAAQLKCPPNNQNLITSVMRRLKRAHDVKGDAMDGFRSDVHGYLTLIVEQVQAKKAEEEKKKQEEEAKKAEQEKEKKSRLGPGGLDPMEVLQSLPEEMRRAFEEKDLPALERLSTEMSLEEFTKHFNRCIDSGLWVVPGAGQAPTASGEGRDDQVNATTPEVDEKFDNDDEPEKEKDAQMSNGIVPPKQ